MKEVIDYVWKMPGEYILIPLAIIVLLVISFIGYMIFSMIRDNRDYKAFERKVHKEIDETNNDLKDFKMKC